MARWLGVDCKVKVFWFIRPIYLWLRSSCQTGLGVDCRVEVLLFTNWKYTQILHLPLNKPSCDPYILAFILQKHTFLINPIPYEPVTMTVIILLSVCDEHEHFDYHFFEHAEQWVLTYTDSVETQVCSHSPRHCLNAVGTTLLSFIACSIEPIDIYEWAHWCRCNSTKPWAACLSECMTAALY